MMIDYVNLRVEFVAIPVPILSPKDNNYYPIIQTSYIQLGDKRLFYIVVTCWQG